MADVITRLKVESQEYDAKIKRAAQGLLQMEDACRKVGGTLAVLEKEDKDFVASLGQMKTVSKSARGRLNELTQAFTDLSIQYKRLTDEEKQGDFGKALSSSLDQLKVRINEAKADLDGVSRELGNTSSVSNETGGVIDNLASKFGLSAKALLGWGTAIAAGKAALDVAKDAFNQSESNIDEWGRTVDGAKGAYSVFLNTLNGGNWSNFFNNLSTAVQGARDLYDALDRLGSIKSNNQAATAIVQQQIAELRLAKQQGQDVDAQIKEATARLAALQKQGVDAGKVAGRMMIGETIRTTFNTQEGASPITQGSVDRVTTELLTQGQEAFDKYKKVFERLEKKAEDYRTVSAGPSVSGYQQSYTERFINMDKLTEEERKQYMLSKAVTEAETRLQEGISAYANAINEETANKQQQFRNTRYALQSQRGAGGGGGGNTTSPSEKEVTIQQQIAALEKEAVTASDERLQEIILTVAALDKQLALEKEIKDVVHGRTPTLNQPVGDRKAFEQQQMVQFEEAFVNVTPKLSEVNISSFISSLKKQLANAEIGSELYNNLTAQITDAQTLGTLISEAVKRGIDVTQINPQELWAKIFGDNPGDYITEDEWKAIQDKLNEYAKKNPIKVNFETGTSQGSSSGAKEAEEKRSMSIAEISRNVLSVTRSLSDLGVEIPDGLTKVLSTMNIITTILGTINTFMGITATTSALKSIPIIGAFLHNGGVVHAANGFSGIVPGTQYSGDQVPAMLDAGEVVLNRAQAGTVASLLTAPQGGNVGRSIATVESDQIKLVLMNGAQSRGMTLGQYLEL